MRIFKEIEKKTSGILYTLLCFRSAELSKAFGLRNICYSKITVVMRLGYRIAGISRKLESERKKMSGSVHAATYCMYTCDWFVLFSMYDSHEIYLSAGLQSLIYVV